MNILIVDADAESVEGISRILSLGQPDWQLSIINSGKQCLDMVKDGSCPDVVILGLRLDDMPGLDLIERIRDYSDIPVIVLSHDKDIDTLVKAFDSGANDYITMPFNKMTFLARFKALIRRRAWDIQAEENKFNKGISHVGGESEG
jgi:two-component system KDP operon response regulator KdpE